VQLTLNFLTPPSNPQVEPPQWTDLDPTARAEAVEILTRMIANAAQAQDQGKELAHD
jgi:hypothetical protein